MASIGTPFSSRLEEQRILEGAPSDERSEFLTGTTKGIHKVFITSRGLAPGRYADECADTIVTMDALFV